MNWAYRITKRDKVAFALGSVFAIIILANWFASYSIELVSNQFREVYHDRLVPSLVISDVMERSYQNRILVEDHILSSRSAAHDSLNHAVLANSQVIDSLISQFERTYLVERENAGLASYKNRFENLVRVQDRILHLSANGDKDEAQRLYASVGREAFLSMLEPLHELIAVQGEVGKELYQSADRQVKTLKILSYLVIGMSVFIALLISTLLQATRKIKNIKPQNYHLN